MLTTETTLWPSPAKLNLFLYINGRREDGYHELQTLFQILDHGDTLSVTANESGKVSIEPEMAGVAQEDNLIYKAAIALKNATGCPCGATIGIDKVLPMGGGIGGGSSNAATVLVALNALWETGLTEDQLADIGVKLGADVPVFIRGTAAFAEGVGEKLQQLDLEEKWYLVAKPDAHISTAHIFGHKDLTRDTPKHSLDVLLSKNYENDCEKVVRRLYPEVDKALSWLLEYAPSRLTGTGACVFAEFDTQQQAQKIRDILPNWLEGFVAKGVKRSPLLDALDALN